MITTTKWFTRMQESYLVCLVIQYNKISVTHIEAWEMITSILSIKYVFIDNKSCAFCIWCIPSEILKFYFKTWINTIESKTVMAEERGGCSFFFFIWVE